MPEASSYPKVFTRLSGRQRELQVLPLDIDIGQASLQTIKSRLACSWGLEQADDLAFEISGSLLEADGVIIVSTQQEWSWIVARHKGVKTPIFITLRQMPKQMTLADLGVPSANESARHAGEFTAVTQERDDLKVLARIQAARLAEYDVANVRSTREILCIVEGVQAELAALKAVVMAPSSPTLPDASDEHAEPAARWEVVQNAHSVPITEYAMLQAAHEATKAELVHLKSAYKDQGDELSRLKAALKALCDGSSFATHDHVSEQTATVSSVAALDAAHAEQVDPAPGQLLASSESSASGYEVVDADTETSVS